MAQESLFEYGSVEAKAAWETRYNRHLASKRWRHLRTQVLNRANRACELCGKSVLESPLEVHHLHYITFGHESASDLLALCSDCHAVADQIRVIVSQQRRYFRAYARMKRLAEIHWKEFNEWAKGELGRGWWVYKSEDDVIGVFADWAGLRGVIENAQG